MSFQVLKCSDPKEFAALWAGDMHANLRVNDRSYAQGQILYIHEMVPDATSGEMTATGRAVVCSVSHVQDATAYGMPDGWVMLSFGFGVQSKIEPEHAAKRIELQTIDPTKTGQQT